MAYGTAWALCLLAETQRLLGDDSAEVTASQAQTTAERLGNRLSATVARLTKGRLAAARGKRQRKSLSSGRESVHTQCTRPAGKPRQC